MKIRNVIVMGMFCTGCTTSAKLHRQTREYVIAEQQLIAHPEAIEAVQEMMQDCFHQGKALLVYPNRTIDCVEVQP